MHSRSTLRGRVASVSIVLMLIPDTMYVYVRCRTFQGNDEADKYVVRLYGALISPLGGKEEEQRLILVMERRAMTLPEALAQGLRRDERTQIASDVAEAMSFLHKKSILCENLRTDSVSVSHTRVLRSFQ